MNEKFMEIAVKLAQNSEEDIPVGAVIVKDDEIIAIANNKKEKTNDVTAHAEILAIKEAGKFLGNWRLNDCELYVTLEPCPMCAWAIMQSRIKTVYFGSYDNLYGAFGSKINLAEISNSKIAVKGGIMEEKCDKILKEFFKRVRNDN
ncbi:nucleoside deaminase [bacterium]|nr:nucleoside deaminase [bacterium]